MEPKSKRRSVAVAVLQYVAGIVSAVVVIVVGGNLTEEDPAPTTKVSFYNALASGKPNPNLALEDVGRGRCIPDHSQASPGNPGARRCFAPEESYVLDPCWVAGEQAICPGDPWASEAYVVKLPPTPVPTGKARPIKPSKIKLPPDSLRAGKNGGPWAMELLNGQRCVYVQGAGQNTVSGVRINYSCVQDGKEKGVVVGYPDQSQPLWTVTYIKGTATKTTSESVAEAVY